MLHTFLEFIEQRPVSARELQPPGSCPSCGAELLAVGVVSTLIGTVLGDGEDPNHRWDTHDCNECGLRVCVESKSGNGWLTVQRRGQPARVLVGVSNCYESYVYNHRGCGGAVTRWRRGANGLRNWALGESGRLEPCHSTWWSCSACRAQIEERAL